MISKGSKGSEFQAANRNNWKHLVTERVLPECRAVDTLALTDSPLYQLISPQGVSYPALYLPGTRRGFLLGSVAQTLCKSKNSYTVLEYVAIAHSLSTDLLRNTVDNSYPLP
jgi:hypothetical protein